MRMRTTNRIWQLGLLLGLLILTACGPAPETPIPVTVAFTNAPPFTPTPRSTPVPGGDIRIGLIGSFTGAGAAQGEAIMRGVQMATNEINKGGGVNGRKIALIDRDDKGSPTEGLVILKDLVEKERVVALIGTSNNEVALAQAPFVQQARIVWLTPMASATRLTQEGGDAGFIFRLAPVDEGQVRQITDFVAARYPKFAVIYEDSPNGLLGRDEITRTLLAKNLQPTLPPEPFKPNLPPEEIKLLLGKLKAAGVSAIISWGSGAEMGMLKRLMKEQNFEVALVGGVNFSMTTPALGMDSSIFFPQTFLADSSVPKQLEFVNRYKIEFKTENIGLPGGVAQTYDAMLMLGEALKATQPLDKLDGQRVATRTGLENLVGFNGVLKNYSKPFALPYRDALREQTYIMSTWREGKIVKVEN
jgi:branched-chain amino acid transport system substrate-binding protein